MSPPPLSLLRVSRGRALWACPPNSVLPTGEALPLPFLKPQVHGWRGRGHFGHVLTSSHTMDLPLPLSHTSLPSYLTRPPPLPRQADLGIPFQGGRAIVFVGRRKKNLIKTSQEACWAHGHKEVVPGESVDTCVGYSNS